MTPARRRWAWLRPVARVVFVVLLLVTLVAFLTPAEDLADPGVDDKVAHALTFLALTLTGLAAGSVRSGLLAGLAAYAVGTEVLQHLLPIGRRGDPADVLADLVGVVLGLLAGVATARAVRRRGPVSRAGRPAAPSPDRPRG